jgi:tRNA 2-thiocytidine biosynthesis protein TtcA
MLDYQMLANGDRVLVAVSGGIDSLLLAWLLHWWRRKAPITYELQIIHLDMQPQDASAGSAAELVVQELAGAYIDCLVVPADRPAPVAEDSAEFPAKDVCFKCARSRRNQLFAYARDNGFTSIALGHHCDDIVETFFLNLTCAGNISTMRPRQILFNGGLALIRPLAYLRKNEITAIGKRLGLQPVVSSCPLSGKTRREDVRDMLEYMYAKIPGSREHIFAALGNVRVDYLLNPATHKQERIHADKP